MNRAYQAQMQRGQYQELGRQENNNAIGALRGAGMQNYYNAFTSGIGAVGYGMEGSKAAREAKAAEDMARDVQVEGVKFRTSDIPTEPDPNELGDMGGMTPDMNVIQRIDATGLERPSIGSFKNGINYNPYWRGIQQQRLNGSQMLRTAPYYQF